MASTYSTWEFYQGEYQGKLSLAQYLQHATEAFGEINMRTLARAAKAPEGMHGALSLCECELVDALHSYVTAYEQLPKGIKSVNNDGYSVSAESGNSASQSRETLKNNELQNICRKYLLFPVNLLYLRGRLCW